MASEQAGVSDPRAIESEVAHLRDAWQRLTRAIGAVFLGQEQVVEELLLGLLAGGHVLVEGVPGLGKTTLVRALAAALDLSFRRIQFTPDLMPGDILGARVLEEDERGRRNFTLQRGPVFANVVLADEINRASPRTQSALLEAMQEERVTLYGETLVLDQPFFLVATENPIEMEGTYPLPEAQLDRFLLKVVIGTPTLDDTVRVLRATHARPEAVEAKVAKVLAKGDVLRMRALVRDVPVADEIVQLIARTVLTTHAQSDAPDDVKRCVRHGASPRGGQALLWTAKARALVHGRLHVSIDDVEALCASALRHRLILGYEGEASGIGTDALARSAFAHARGRTEGSWR
jgi:MoxR-like ATPase